MFKISEEKIFPVVAASLGIAVAALWGAFLFVQLRLGSGAWPKILPGFDTTEAGLGPVHGSVPGVIVKCLAIFTLLAILTVALTYFRSSLHPALLNRVMSAAITVGITWILFEGMLTRGYQGDWYNIQRMMTHPGEVPIFGQRLLFVWPAMLIKHFVPRLTYIQAFLTVQAVGIGVAVFLIGKWSALFIGERLKFLGQIFLAVFWLPTFNYFTAHDVGVVVTYAMCFYALYKRGYGLFVFFFCLAVLNHPNALLLVPTAAAVMWGREKFSTVAWVSVATLAAYAVIRVVLNIEVPLPRSVDLRLWWNMREFAELPRMLILGTLAIVPFYIFGLVAFRAADRFLKAASVLLPLQFLVFLYYGQLNESRLFNGFLPILIGIFLCWLGQFLNTELERPTQPSYEISANVS